MAQITTHCRISSPVPFLDVDVSKDNRMFVDPHSIRLQAKPQPFLSEAKHAIDSFFGEITACVLSRSPADERRGLDMLQHFEEPWETRLGLAKAGFSGHGGAEEIGALIWGSLSTDLRALVRVGILQHVEELALFVKGVDRDITSDVTTRVVFGALANFTAQMMIDFPEFRSGGNRSEKFDRQVWDPAALTWAQRRIELPVVNGKPLLLVPRDWARHTLLMSAGRFYETSVLSYAQLEQTVFGSDGKLLKTRKDDLKEQDALARGRATNLSVTLRAKSKDENLVAMFRQFVDDRYEPLTDEEIRHLLR